MKAQLLAATAATLLIGLATPVHAAAPSPSGESVLPVPAQIDYPPAVSAKYKIKRTLGDDDEDGADEGKGRGEGHDGGDHDSGHDD